MKKFLMLFLTVGVLLGSTAFTKYHSSGVLPSGVYKIMEVTYLWNLLNADFQLDYDRDDTYLETGFRAKYAMAKKYASVELMERAFGKKVFLSGPHGRDMNFKSTSDFGHYNPAFLNDLHTALEQSLDNDYFAQIAEYLLDEDLSIMFESYATAYVYLQDHPEKMEELKKAYLAELAKPSTSEGALNTPLGQIPEFETSNVDWYDAYTAAAFWVRRSIDGTDDEFVKILELIEDKLD